MPRSKLNPFAGISYHVPLSRIEYFLRPTIDQTNLYPELRRACLNDKVGKDCGCMFSSFMELNKILPSRPPSAYLAN